MTMNTKFKRLVLWVLRPFPVRVATAVYVQFPDWWCEFVARYIPRIPRKKPTPPNNGICDRCGELLYLCAHYECEDGWEFYWNCKNTCRDDLHVNWWPFYFGAWAKTKHIERVGIEVQP